MTKIKWIFPIIMLLMFPVVQSFATYGNGSYGSCDYGRNTEPNITAFQPVDLTPSFEPPLNITFNITFSDCENDTLTISWFVDDVFNVSDQNLTYAFSKEKTFNITGNVTDSFDQTTQTWIVLIQTTLGLITVTIEDFGIEWISFNWTPQGDLVLEYSEDNLTDWKNVSTVDNTFNEANQVNLQAETEYFFRIRNSTSSFSYLVKKTKAIREGDQYYIYLVAGILFITLLLFGYLVEDDIFKIFAGMVPIIIAINIFNEGFPNLTNEFLKNGFVSLLLGIGFYFILKPSIEFLENFKFRT